jgi:hypothetical protein
MPTLLSEQAAGPAPLDTTSEVIAAARDLARRYTLTPRWSDRLIPEAVRLVAAVTAHDRPRSAVTCLSCGAEWGQQHLPGCQFEQVTA